MLFLNVNKNEIENTERLQEMLDNKKNVFVLVYMIGCMPCKYTLPEWNKLRGCKELEQFRDNDDIVVANVEQSMCEKMHHKDLENIMSFPTIKHIRHNDVQDYNDERNTKAFSKWIKELIKKDDKPIDLNGLVINAQNKTNHGNIDMLIKPKQTRMRRRKLKTKKNKPKRKQNQKTKPKRTTIIKIKPQTKKKGKRKNKTMKRKSKTNRPNTRRIFQKPLSYTKSLPI